MSTINIEQFEKIVEFNIDNNIKRAILGLGASGIGKSAVIKQITEKKKYGSYRFKAFIIYRNRSKRYSFPKRR